MPLGRLAPLRRTARFLLRRHCDKAEAALKFYRPEQLFLNTDCWFGCFAGRCVKVEDIAAEKLKSMAAARILRERWG